jgi:hypothetical protein
MLESQPAFPVYASGILSSILVNLFTRDQCCQYNDQLDLLLDQLVIWLLSLRYQCIFYYLGKTLNVDIINNNLYIADFNFSSDLLFSTCL